MERGLANTTDYFFLAYFYKHIHPVWMRRKNESAFVISCDVCCNDVMNHFVLSLSVTVSEAL